MILYSTGCPRCKVLKAKLDQKGFVYEENNSVGEMLDAGIDEVPMLSVDNNIMNFVEAIEWINKQ